MKEKVKLCHKSILEREERPHGTSECSQHPHMMSDFTVQIDKSNVKTYSLIYHDQNRVLKLRLGDMKEKVKWCHKSILAKEERPHAS